MKTNFLTSHYSMQVLQAQRIIAELLGYLNVYNQPN
jgi:hypothetical protein